MPFGIDLFSAPAPATRRPVLDMGGPESACAMVRVALRMGPALDTVSCVLATARSELAAGDGLTVAMGYADTRPEDIFSGTVSSISTNVHGQTIVTAGNGGEALARMRINQSFVDMSAGDIITDLAGRAGVDAAEILDGTDLPLYVADDRAHLLDHIATLAGFSGADVTFDAGGGLVCAVSGETPSAVAFAYGASIAAGRMQQRIPLETPFQSTGEGAAGSDGDDAWPWIAADSGSTASGDPGGGVASVGALRSADAVSGYHEARMAAQARMAGTILIDAPGTPILRPGNVFTVEHDALGGEYVAAEVIHSYNKTAGFRTRVYGWSKGGSGGLPGGLL
jgi:hypothetical protein